MSMIRSPRLSRLVAAAVPVLVALALAGCRSTDDVAAPTESDLVLTDADAKVNGQSLAGRTLHADDPLAGHVHFEAHLHDPAAGAGHMVRVDFAVPGMGMGMMRREGSFLLHDDGTHGDPVAHDGIYCYTDSTDVYGCRGANAQMGDYHYEFCGYGADGRQSNRVVVDVVMAP